MRARFKWVGLWTVLGLVSGVQLFFAEQRLALHPYGWWQALATTLPAWYVWGLLALVVAWLGRRFRVDRANFGRHFFIHLGASLDLALLQRVMVIEGMDHCDDRPVDQDVPVKEQGELVHQLLREGIRLARCGV